MRTHAHSLMIRRRCLSSVSMLVVCCAAAASALRAIRALCASSLRMYAHQNP
jgi:hypothetical protein